MVNEILLESGGTDFILLEDGTALLLETPPEEIPGGGAGPAGTSTSVGATSLAQQQLIPKRKTILESYLRIQGLLQMSLHTKLSESSILVKPLKVALKVESALSQQYQPKIQVNSKCLSSVGIRLEITGYRILSTETQVIKIIGQSYCASCDMILSLKKEAMRKFYE